jgi:hypothetical protein
MLTAGGRVELDMGVISLATRFRVARPESSKGVVDTGTPFEDSGRATHSMVYEFSPLATHLLQIIQRRRWWKLLAQRREPWFEVR